VQKETAARFNVKSAEQRLDNANEELRQLKKMYDADDLTEETEEIILKRQKFNVEASEYGLEQARQMAEVSLKTALPREHDTLKALARDQSFALELADQTLPRQLLRKRLEVDKLKRERGKSDKRLADLKNDLALLSVKAPADGVVYYGACENGRWTTGGALAKKLVPNGKLMPNEVFMTLVNPDKLELKAVAAEAELAHLRPGLEGKATPVRAPDKPLRVRLDELEEVPLPSGGFQAVLSFRQEPGVLLLPGMNCKIVFEDLEKPSALLAPKEAVFGEGSERYVLVAGKDGKAEKRVVKVGEADAKRIEILEGLTEGSKILLKKPE
jgi:multidrug efflux pump subunit AcrA (membrane-fusion protein)